MGIFKKSNAARLKYHFKDRVERGEFRGNPVTELEIPASVQLIGDSAFRECRRTGILPLPRGNPYKATLRSPRNYRSRGIRTADF